MNWGRSIENEYCQRSLAKVIEDLPENVQVGIRVVYGKGPGGGETAKEGGCKEFALLSPMAQLINSI